MKVVILCGGMGTRLREETEFIPKPLVKIGNKPILWHIMKRYSDYGFNDFVLCLGYKGDKIKEYFANYDLMNNDLEINLGDNNNYEKIKLLNDKNSYLNWKIILADTGMNSLKGSRIKKVEKYIDGDTFMVTYGDGLADVDLISLLEFHKAHKKVATLTGVFSPSRFGVIGSQDNLITSFKEKPSDIGSVVNGGFFVFNREIFDYLNFDDNCDLEFGVFEKLVEMKELMVYKHQGNWYSMDTIRDVEYLNRLWNLNIAFWSK